MKPRTRRRAVAIRDSLVGVLAAAFVACLLRAAPATAQTSFPPDSTVRAMLEEVVSSGTAKGLVVGLLDPDGSRRVVAYGDPGPDALPFDGESVFDIGSMTKVFTGILLADMVRRGEVELADPVADLLPSDVNVPARNGKVIPLLDLTTHHSGLPTQPGNLAGDPGNPWADYTVQRLYDFVSGYELPRDPGAAFEYSNVGMGLLGQALASRAGTTYEALVRDRILEPLGMSHTAIELTPRMQRHLVRGHDRSGEPAPNWFVENGRVGLNWFVSTPGERTIRFTGGLTGGYSSFLGLDLEARRAVVVLANTGLTSIDHVGFRLLDPTVPLGREGQEALELPIIDMHLHAHRLADYGGGMPVCANDQEIVFAGLDPGGDSITAATFSESKSCASPVRAPTSDEDLMHETLALLERHNIFAVTTGPLERVAAWRLAAPDRIIPAHAFGDPGSPPPSEFRGLVEAGELALFAEVSPQYQGMRVDDPALEPYFALAEELDVPVGVHLGEGPYGGPYWATPDYRARLTSPFQLEEVLIRHPRLRVYVMHYGSPLVDEMIALMYAHPQVYVDVAGNDWGYPRAHFYRQLRKLIEAGLGERIMWGSDQMVWPRTIEIAIETIEKAPFLSESQKRDIFYNNAARFLRLSEEEIARHHGRVHPGTTRHGLLRGKGGDRGMDPG